MKKGVEEFKLGHICRQHELPIEIGKTFDRTISHDPRLGSIFSGECKK